MSCECVKRVRSSIVDELFRISVKFPKGNDLTEVIDGYKMFGFSYRGGNIDGRHISIIALSEHHVDYMNRKGWSLRYCAGGTWVFHRCAWTRAWRQGSGKL